MGHRYQTAESPAIPQGWEIPHAVAVRRRIQDLQDRAHVDTVHSHHHQTGAKGNRRSVQSTWKGKFQFRMNGPGTLLCLVLVTRLCKIPVLYRVKFLVLAFRLIVLFVAASKDKYAVTNDRTGTE